MKLCISSTGRDLSAAVDPRFGRAAGYVFVDTESTTFESVENPAAMAGGGAGLPGGKGGEAGHVYEAGLFPVRFLFRDRHEAPYGQLVAGRAVYIKAGNKSIIDAL